MLHNFTFIDLFAGIGGFRIPLESLGGTCIGFSEINKNAIETYKKNFIKHSTEEYDLGDITKLNKLPTVDLLVGGVPCQSWSVAGKMRGFEDPRGRLWYDSIRLVEINHPKAFIFENVKGLYDPRNKANLNLILSNFKKLGYHTYYKLLNSYDFGLPQNRERIFIVGIRNDIKLFKPFVFPNNVGINPPLSKFFDNVQTTTRIKEKFSSSDLFGNIIPPSRNKFQKSDEFNDFFVLCDTRNGHTTIHSWDIIETSDREKDICLVILKNRRKKKYGNKDGNPLSYQHLKDLIIDLEENELKQLVKKNILKYKESIGYEFVNSKNSAGINGIYRIYLPHSHIFSTLTATGTKDMIALEEVSGKNIIEYKNNFINQILKKNKYRNITPKEAAKLQGFPEDFILHPNKKVALFQFGNAVSVPVIHYLMKALLDTQLFSVFNNDEYGRTEKTRNPSKSKNMDERYSSYQTYSQHA